MSDNVSITITQQSDYRFSIDFGDAIAALQVDESPPLGGGAGPTPEHLLLAAVGNCLAASLLFALRKFKHDPGGITATVTCTIERNENKRLRVQEIQVAIRIGADSAGFEHLDRVLAQFEDFCTVSQSVQSGIPFRVSVSDGAGRQLK